MKIMMNNDEQKNYYGYGMLSTELGQYNYGLSTINQHVVTQCTIPIKVSYYHQHQLPVLSFVLKKT